MKGLHYKHKSKAFLLIFVISLSFLSSLALIAAQPNSLLEMSGPGWNINIQGLQVGQNGVAVVTQLNADQWELTYSFASLSDVKPNGFLNFIVAFNGIKSYKQSALDLELEVGSKYDFVNETHALKNGVVIAYRPLNMVDSHAIYTDAGEKVAHISRTKLIDAANNEIYADTAIMGNVLRVYLPMAWLQTAIYPVLVDPIFGYTTIGVSWTDMFGFIAGSNFIAPASGNVTDITVYFASGSGNIRLAIYNGTDDALLEESGSEAFTSPAWNTLSGFNQWINETEEYYLMIQTDANGTGASYDTLHESGVYVIQSYGVFPTSISGKSIIDSLFSIYANYTLYVEPTPTPAPEEQEDVSDSLDLGLYVIMLGLLAVLAILAFKFWPVLGAMGGLLGAVFSYICLSSTGLITQTVYDPALSIWVYQVYPMGFFAYVPVLLMVLNFVLVVKK